MDRDLGGDIAGKVLRAFEIYFTVSVTELDGGADRFTRPTLWVEDDRVNKDKPDLGAQEARSQWKIPRMMIRAGEGLSTKMR